MDQSPELYLEEIELRSSEPAEDGHTPLPTNHTEATKRISTWKLVYYGSALILVLAVWTVALLPSVLTFSIVRSPVQVIYYYVQSRVSFITVDRKIFAVKNFSPVAWAAKIKRAKIRFTYMRLIAELSGGEN